MGNRDLKFLKAIYRGKITDFPANTDEGNAERQEWVKALNPFVVGEDKDKLVNFFGKRDGRDGSLIYVSWVELPKAKGGEDEIRLVRVDNNDVELIDISQEQMKGIEELCGLFRGEMALEQV